MSVKVRLNITGDFPPFEYRLQGDINWQDSPVFELPEATGAVSYTFEVRDSEGCIQTFTFEEEKLVITSAGATSQTGSVVPRWRTNVPAENKIFWGIEPGDLTEEDWNNDFVLNHIRPLPLSFVGSNHYYKAIVRSRFGQIAETQVLGIYAVLGELLVSSPMDVDYMIEKVSDGLFIEKSSNLFIQGYRNFETLPLLISAAFHDVSKITPVEVEKSTHFLLTNTEIQINP